jgi:uncharacterized surface protein with fasciclin (FAS1) repeats
MVILSEWSSVPYHLCNELLKKREGTDRKFYGLFAQSLQNADGHLEKIQKINQRKTMRLLKLAILPVMVIFAVAMTTNNEINKTAENDIIDLAVNTDILSTLVAAVQAADLVEVLQGDGPFTVFAPTNEAFAKLPEGTVENLLKPENKDQLIAVLTYHVVPGKVMSGDLSDNMNATTVQGSDVNVRVNNYGVRVNGARVVQADIEATNGVVHVIDTVILPGN